MSSELSELYKLIDEKEKNQIDNILEIVKKAEDLDQLSGSNQQPFFSYTDHGGTVCLNEVKY